MAQAQKAAADRLSQKEDVKKALQQTTPGEAEPKPVSKARRLTWVGVYGALLVVLVALYVLIANDVISLPGWKDSFLNRLPLAAVLVVGLLFVEHIVETFGIEKVKNTVTRYNLTRVVRLATGVLLVGAAGTILFGNFYTGLVSLGVISIIVGLAVQTPMTSFIGWIYILIRAPYRVGDRIKIGDATGDVIEVVYLDTTLWEFGGQYLSTDHPSGR
ncbi:MAG TPA: mechanosensitive ion channel domain-containing protein, partial [Thermoanaerobaculia bacterium]